MCCSRGILTPRTQQLLPISSFHRGHHCSCGTPPSRFRESSLVGVAAWDAHPCTTPLTMLWASSILSIRVPNDVY